MFPKNLHSTRHEKLFDTGGAGSKHSIRNGGKGVSSMTSRKNESSANIITGVAPIELSKQI